jgi:rhamnogalacturonyl hydrolase YesR
MSIAKNGWQGLLTKIQPDGQVQDICVGTGINEDIKFYYTRPAKLNDIHGLGAVLLAGLEIIKAK